MERIKHKVVGDIELSKSREDSRKTNRWSIFPKMLKKKSETPKLEKRLDFYDKKYPSKKAVLASMDHYSEHWYVFGHQDDKVASGSMGIITKGKLVRNVFEPVSPMVSCVSIKEMIRYEGIPKDTVLRRLDRQVELWMSLDNKNILRFFGRFTPSTLSSPDMIYMVSEYARFGNSEAFLKRDNNRQQFASKLVDDVICGMKYLHCVGEPYDKYAKPKPGVKYLLYHGDLKPNNILVGGDEKEPIAWIGDFDFTGVSVEGGTLATTGSETRYTAPELLNLPSGIDREKRRYYLEKGDIYALGFTVYTMLTGNLPFANLKSYYDFRDFKIRSRKDPSYFAEHCPQMGEMDNSMYDVFSPCWTFEADKRPSMKSIAVNYEAKFPRARNLNTQ